MNISRTVPCPCKNCQERWFNVESLDRCHNHCIKYKEYKNKIEINRDKYTQDIKALYSRYDDLTKWSARKKSIANNKRRKQTYKTM